MAYVILLNLQVILFFIHLIVKHFKKKFICHFAMDNIVVYHTIIIPNTLNKVANCIELKVVNG